MTGYEQAVVFCVGFAAGASPAVAGIIELAIIRFKQKRNTKKETAREFESVVEKLKSAGAYSADLSGASLSGANLTGADLSGANVSGVTFHGVNHTLRGAKF